MTPVKDFIDRDQTTFTSADQSNRLHWERDTRRGFSQFLTKNNRIADGAGFIRKAFQFARQRMVAMRPPKGTQLRFTIDANCTDGRTVQVATRVLDDKRLDIFERLDVLLGEVTHEVAHVLYTDFALSASRKASAFLHDIRNTIEDERIEREIGKDFPGYSNDIAQIKKYIFDLLHKKINIEEKNDVELLGYTFFRLVRYPTDIDPRLLHKFSAELDEIREILTPYPTTNEEMLDASDAVYEVFARFFDEKKEEEENKDQGQSQGNDANDKADDSDADDDSSSKNNEEPDTNNDQNAGSGSGEEDDNSDDSSNQNDSADGNDSDDEREEVGNGDDHPGDIGNNDSLADADTLEEAVREISRILSELLDSPNDEGTGSEQESEMIRNHDAIVRQEQGEVVIYDKSIFIKPDPNQSDRYAYSQIAKEIRPFVGTLSTKLRLQMMEKVFAHKGQKTGRLDGNKLVEAVLGNEYVYESQETVTPDAVSLVLLIDESGSMGHDKMATARNIAVLFNEAVKKVQNLELFIYGFTSASYEFDSEQQIYKEPGIDFRDAMGAMRSKYSNADHRAILDVADRVRKFTANKCLFIVLSDGQPASSCYSSYEDGINQTREAVKAISKKGFVPIQIGIQTDYTENPMFDDWVQFSDLSAMVKEVGKLLNRKVKDLT